LRGGFNDRNVITTGIRTSFEELRGELSSSGGFFDVAARKQELKTIEKQASEPDFWKRSGCRAETFAAAQRAGEKIDRQEHLKDNSATLLCFLSLRKKMKSH